MVNSPNKNVSSSDDESNQQASTNDLNRGRRLLKNSSALYLSTEEDDIDETKNEENVSTIL